MHKRRKSHRKNKRIWGVLLIISTLLLVVIIAYDSHQGKVKQKELQAYNQVLSNEKKLKDERNKDINNQLDAYIKENIPGIVCWGDSLTAGAGGNGISYPSILQELIIKNIYNIPVENMGVGGEDTLTILGRTGSKPMIVDAFTIPSDLSKVEIKFRTTPLRQGDKGINPCVINDVEGYLTIEQDSAISTNFKYYFQRSNNGTAVEVHNNTKIQTSASTLYKDYMPIIFIGQNGGYDSDDELIEQIKLLVDYNNNDMYLVLGLTSGTEASRKELETKMDNEFGKKYINLRNSLSKSGVEDAGLIANAEDMMATVIGKVPPSLHVDEVHLNDKGYTLIGNIVYNRMVELGYFDEILELKYQLN